MYIYIQHFVKTTSKSNCLSMNRKMTTKYNLYSRRKKKQRQKSVFISNEELMCGRSVVKTYTAV